MTRAAAGLLVAALRGDAPTEGRRTADEIRAQAAEKAQSYLDFSTFSRQGLIDQLVFEGFSVAEAEHGATAVGY